jgi:hypothetical protein
MFKIIAILFLSIIIFFVGYNITFKTNKTVSIFNTLSKSHRDLPSGYDILWAKISGIGIMIFALIIFLIMVYVLFTGRYKKF